MAVSKTLNFNTGEVGMGKYEWAKENPIRGILQRGRERYYESLEKSGYTHDQVADIEGRDHSLPLVGSRYYVVTVAKEPKALLRVYGAKNEFTNPRLLAAGEKAKPVNPEFDRDRTIPIELEIGNAFTDSQDGSGIRYADFWEYGWLKCIKNETGDTRRPISIHATASEVGARLYSRLYKFSVLEDRPKPGYFHLEVNPEKFLKENEGRIMRNMDRFREKVGLKEPYSGHIRVNHQ